MIRHPKSSSKSNYDYSSHPVAQTLSSQTGVVMGVASPPTTKAICPIISAKDTSVLRPSEDAHAMLHTGTSHMVLGPTCITAGSGAGCDQNPSAHEQDGTITTNAFPAALTNPPHGFSRSDSWDRLYLDEHGSIQWNGVFIDEQGSVQWDGLYIDKDGLLQSAGVETWDNLHSSTPAIN